MKRVAIVILNWNGRAMLERFLPSVVAHSSSDADVIVADNGSTDDSLRLLSEHFPTVATLPLDRNYGFAEGYNRALKELDYEYFVLLNSDVEVVPGWLEPLIAFMDSHASCAACQPKLLAEHDYGSFEYAGAAGGYLDRYGYPFCRGRIFDTVERDTGQYDDVAEVLWATGACLMIRRCDYFAAGGLDRRFFAHNEEIDLCWRLNIRGRKICCVPQSHVYHVGGGTLPQGSATKTYLNFRNNLTMLYKNLKESQLRRVMLVRWALDYVAAYQALLLHGNVGDFKAIYRARHDFRRRRADFRADRERIAASRVDADAEPLSPVVILWQYYARGRKRFAQLPGRGGISP